MTNGTTNESDGLQIIMISVHGLIRGTELELGRDADTGGQTKYVLELAKAVARNEGVSSVKLVTRQVFDSRVSTDYAQPLEKIADNAEIVRLPCGPKRYLRKESLWTYLDCFADNLLRYIREQRLLPSAIHSHYADAGYVGCRVASLLDIPLIFTGHSLGNDKLRQLKSKGQSAEAIDRKYNISQRIEAEEETLSYASAVIASTRQEVEQQYASYDHYQPERMVVIPPGTDIQSFSPPTADWKPPAALDQLKQFLRDPQKPPILAIARADERKNLTTLVQAYGESEKLRTVANLIIIAGNRETIADLDKGSRRVISKIIELIDNFDLYGQVAYPKQHKPEDIPDYYRFAAALKGVFVNPALTEPFGLTLIEAAATGLPIVATNDGGPQEILENCKHGLLIDPISVEDVQNKLLQVLTDTSQWKSYSKQGREGAEQFYTWDGHAKRYLKEVRRLHKINRNLRRSNPCVIKKPDSDRALISDIDGTLLGDRGSLDVLLKRVKHEHSTIGFGVATGRTISMTLSVLEEWDVPVPDVLITSVGTEIYYGPNITYDLGWHELINYRWDPAAIRAFMAGINGAKLQSNYKQRTFKVSYDVNEDFIGVQQLRRMLRQQGIHATVIYSHDEFLDLLPLRASKGAAVRYFADKWSIPLENVLVAGDSGNDADMMVGRTMGAVVGNHEASLRKLKNLERVFFAQSHYAAGILEAAEHFRFFE